MKMSPSGLPDTGYGLGIFNVAGWIGHNGSLPGYESLVVYLPEAKATLVVLLNTDINYKGSEPSTLFGQAITRIVSPQHVFKLPAQPAGQ
jgi:D-alanyl-D-alanine carboxypeptidase